MHCVELITVVCKRILALSFFVPPTQESVTASGLKIKKVVQGKGPVAAVGDLIGVRFKGNYGNYEFDNIFNSAEPYYMRAGVETLVPVGVDRGRTGGLQTESDTCYRDSPHVNCQFLSCQSRSTIRGSILEPLSRDWLPKRLDRVHSLVLSVLVPEMCV